MTSPGTVVPTATYPDGPSGGRVESSVCAEGMSDEATLLLRACARNSVSLRLREVSASGTPASKAFLKNPGEEGERLERDGRSPLGNELSPLTSPDPP